MSINILESHNWHWRPLNQSKCTLVYVQNWDSLWLDCSISKDILWIRLGWYPKFDKSFLDRTQTSAQWGGRRAKCFTGFPFVSALTSDTFTAKHPLWFHRLGRLTTVLRCTLSRIGKRKKLFSDKVFFVKSKEVGTAKRRNGWWRRRRNRALLS